MDYFEIFAECSIALLGFGAVHAVLRGSDGPRGLIRAWVVVTQGAFAFLLSILPLLLANSPWANDTIWRASSAIGVIGVSALVYTMIRFDRQLIAMHIRNGNLPFRNNCHFSRIQENHLVCML